MDERKEEDAGFSSENDEEGDEVEYNCVDGYIPLCQDEERGEISLGRSVSEASDDVKLEKKLPIYVYRWTAMFGGIRLVKQTSQKLKQQKLLRPVKRYQRV